MQATPEFKTLGQYFFQDLERMGDTLDDVMEFVLSPFKGDARVRLRRFIDEALREDVPDAELLALWDSTPADLYFRSADGLRHMLREARARL